MLVDSHCHLDFPDFADDLDGIINRAAAAGIGRCILRNRAANQPFSVAQAFAAKDFNQRRFHQKELFYRMPARPLLK